MAAIEMMKDLFFIERGLLNGNHFVYRSEAPVLIDTGYVSDFSVTEKLIGDLGVDIDRTRLIICTHTHCDHIGGNRLIQDRSGCDIYLHRYGMHYIRSGDDWSTWWRYYNQEADPFHCSHGLVDGEELMIGPHKFQVIHTPGHSSDGIVLYNHDEGVLISSDSLWENDVPTMTIRVEGSTALFRFIESLERLGSLRVSVVYPGHGRPFYDFKAALSRSRKKIEGYLSNPARVGDDLLKKIVVYTLMMHRGFEEGRFFEHLMTTHWFRETVEFYFGDRYLEKYEEIVGRFLERGIVVSTGDRLFATVKP